MNNAERLWRRLTEHSDLPDAVFPGQPVVEIAGDSRVLIENHLGVNAYGSGKIVVKVKYGWIHICGDCMELKHMSADQLVICGRIHHVALQRRNG